MFSEMFNEHGDNPMFQKVICTMVEKLQMQVTNDLKLGELTIDDDIVKAVWVSQISNVTAFELMENFNLILNGADETAFANVNQFIQQIKMIYLDGEEKKEEVLNRGL